MATNFNQNAASLLSATNRIEVPYIKVQIGKYTFGTYDKQYLNETSEQGFYKKAEITYPNYVQSLNITKINGRVNQYELNLTYPIKPGDDPNFFEKVFSSVKKTRKIIFTYGDMSAPEYIYRNEQAIITKVGKNFDPQNAKINYTVYAISSSTLSYSGSYTFGGLYKKPSDEIKRVLKDPSLGLSSLFYGMKNMALVEQYNLIESDDKEVYIERHINTTPLDYLRYLVSIMVPNGLPSNSNKTQTFYILTIHDEAENEIRSINNNNQSLRELGGPYFKITKVSKNLKHPEAYNIVFGYPSGNIITAFNIENNENYSIYYDYQADLNTVDYVERISDSGEIEKVYAPLVSSGNYKHKTRTEDITWWSKITEYPINATMTIKGLLRPALLMEYVNLNIIYFGKKYVDSGLYIITKQVDNISERGCRTTLNMTRVDSPEDFEDLEV